MRLGVKLDRGGSHRNGWRPRFLPARAGYPHLMTRKEALEALRSRARDCQACPLWRDATQTVFGEGPLDAPIVLVGEQPGDQEDREGHPFVGPAGRVLDELLARAGIERSSVYTTNAVKHFKYRQRGKRRIHQRPSAGESSACRQWLEAELELLSPEVVVALGATAGHSLFGRAVRIGQDRGHPLESSLFSPVVLTAHPASALRQRDSDARHDALRAIAEDLSVAGRIAREAHEDQGARAGS